VQHLLVENNYNSFPTKTANRREECEK